jgi:hypothetical protein
MSYDANVDWRQCFIHRKLEAEKVIEQSLLQSVKERRDSLTITDETVLTFNKLAIKYGPLMHNYSIVQMCLRLVSTVTKLEELLPNVPVKIEEWKKESSSRAYWSESAWCESFIRIGYTEAIARILLAVYHYFKDDSHDVELILKLINDSKPRYTLEPEISPLDLTPFTTDLSYNLRLLPRREWSREDALSLVKAYGLTVEPIRVCPSCNDIEYMSLNDDCGCNNPTLELTVRRLFKLGDNPFLTLDRTQLMTVLELAIIMNKKFKWDYIGCSDRIAFIHIINSGIVCEWWLRVDGEPRYSRLRNRVTLNVSTQKVDISEVKKFDSIFD